MKKKILLLISLFFLMGSASSQSLGAPLTFEINFTGGINPTTNNPIVLSLPLRFQDITDYEFYIDWENNGTLKKYKMVNEEVIDGDVNADGDLIKSYIYLFNENGLKTIKIYGPDFPGFKFSNTNDRIRGDLKRIISWGDVVWQFMEEAFKKCNNLSIENNAGAIPIPNPISMKEMFRGSAIGETGNLNSWDVSKVTDMSYMFSEAEDFNQDLSNWNVENVTDMERMFYKANNFNNGGTHLTWGEGTRNVTNMREMFASGSDQDEVSSLVSKFNQDIGNWNVSSVSDMVRMFFGASSFNNGEQTIVWNTQKVELMVQMFNFASSFNQNIGEWNIGSIGISTTIVGTMEKMLVGVNMSRENFEATLIGWDNFVQTNNKPLNVNLDVSEIYYCDSGQYAIQHLEAKGWDIDFPKYWVDYHEKYSICDPNKFVISFKVNDNETIVIPTSSEETYNYKVFWGDESTNENLNSHASHTYAKAGTYSVKIEGDFPRIDFSISEAISTRAKVRTIKNWGSTKWTSFEKAFYKCTNLKISNNAGLPDLSLVNNLSYMFQDCIYLNDEGNIGSWDVNKVTNMSGLFINAQKFNQNLSNWNVSNVIDMSRMFQQARAFVNKGAPLSWAEKTRNVTNMTAMFNYASNFNQPINDWDVSNVTTMTWMFNQALKFNQDLSNWNVGKVTNMARMFVNTPFNQNLSNWDVSSVTSVYWMFKEASKYNNGGVSLNWGESAKYIINMEGMFSNAIAFNQPINWDVSGVESMKDMFRGAIKFNQDVSNWEFSNVTNMSWMFFRAYDFNNGGNPLIWNDKTKNVTNMALMFYEISVFNQPIIWNMSNVTNMDSMLKGCTSFNQDISSWNVSKVVHMSSVFYDATSFNQDIGDWEVSKVRQMQNLFRGAIAFNQDISNWNVSKVTYMNDMFKDVILSTDNYDKLLASWSQKVKTTNGSFHGGNSLYCNQTARDEWKAKGWTISDGGQANNCSLSIDDEHINKMKIYPNPFSTTAKIQLNGLVNNTSIKLFNIQGKLVKLFKNIKSNVLDIDREGLSNGIYFLQILEGNRPFAVEKLIIK